MTASVELARRADEEWASIRSLPEEEYDELVDALHAMLADEDLDARARRLRERHLDGGRFDLRVATALARLSWYRHLFLPDRIPPAELASAVTLFRQVHAEDPRQVPALLVPAFDPGADSGRDEDDLDVLTVAAWDLIACGDEHRDDATALALAAAGLAGRLPEVSVDQRAELAETLAECGLTERALAEMRVVVARTPGDDDARLRWVVALVALAAEIDAEPPAHPLPGTLALLLAEVRAAAPENPSLPEVVRDLASSTLAALRDGLDVPHEHVAEVLRAVERVPEDAPEHAEALWDALLAAAYHVLEPEDAAEPGELRHTIESRLGRHFGRDGHPTSDLAVATEVADLCWDRFLAWPDHVPDGKLAFAVALFQRLPAVHRDSVPELLRPSLDPGLHETGTDEEDVWVLALCACRLFSYADGAEPRREFLDHARGLTTRARTLGRRLGTPTGADVRAMLATALLHLFGITDDHELLDEAEELVASFEPDLLGGLTGDGTGTIEDRRAALIRSRDAERAAANPAQGEISLLETLADVRWYRYQHGAETTGADLALVIALYEHLHVAAPEVVPNGLRVLIEPGFGWGAHGDEGDAAALAAWAVDLFDYAGAEAVPGQDAPPSRFLEYAFGLTARSAALVERLADPGPLAHAALAGALLDGFDHTGDQAVLDQAVEHARAAVARTPPDDGDRLIRLVVLGRALMQVADTRRDPAALQEAMDLLRPVVEAADTGNPHTALVAGVLAGAHGVRSGWNTGMEVAAETMREFRRLMPLIPEGTPGRTELAMAGITAEMNYFTSVNDAGGARQSRAELDRILARMPAGTSLYDIGRLASAAFAVFEHLLDAGTLREQALLSTPGPVRDAALDRALARYRELFQSVRSLSPLERADQLSVFVTMLISVDTARGSFTPDSDEWLTLLEEALAGIPAGSEQYRLLRGELGWMLLYRYRLRRDTADLDRAIALLRHRLADPAGTDDPGSRHLAAGNLGAALRERYLLTGDEDSYREGMAALRSVVDASAARVLERLASALIAAQLAADAGRWPAATEVLARGVALVARLTWRGLNRPSQEKALVMWADATKEAAAAAVRAGDPGRAVELLEQGRASLSHQALDTRGDTSRLRDEHPDLARRLDGIDAAIERTGDHARRHALAAEWDALVAEIRSRPGLARFLRPPGHAELRPAPGQTVVMVNPADFGSCALVATDAGVRTVALPALTTGGVREHVETFHAAIDRRVRAADDRERRAAADTMTAVLDWLWHTTAEPILADLGHTRAPAPGAPWPRVHWCPTWLLGFLPLHAAASRDTGAAVLDRVASSYTISLRMLRAVTRRADPASPARSLLVVSLPDTPGLPPLPGARRESAHLAGLPVPATTLTGDRATRDAVRGALAGHPWAHFSCHAAQDPLNPSRGRIFLHDHKAAPFTVLDISRLRLEDARLAFLSACETARGGLRLPDEALHLGGALQLAGFQHVIATMWPVEDEVAAWMTARMYDRMHTAGALDPARAALALHEAARALRHRHPADPILWASHLHFGP
ncbi:CHAT domain-containing protein [Actinomadura craniellae]|uniref:CHAT domain-containing protein n=1 Tax=Actinomadura craniellae TaxID=2231787 RepID=UPI0011BF33CC|nr:CHAT domain-containing protein [Actinomadura craniellae]